jgi:hypothetical protein
MIHIRNLDPDQLKVPFEPMEVIIQMMNKKSIILNLVKICFECQKKMHHFASHQKMIVRRSLDDRFSHNS